MIQELQVFGSDGLAPIHLATVSLIELMNLGLSSLTILREQGRLLRANLQAKERHIQTYFFVIIDYEASGKACLTNVNQTPHTTKLSTRF